MKKLLSIILAGTMLFSFAACGDDKEEKEKSKGKNDSDIVKDSGIDIGDAEVGEYITFGSYEQDNDTSNGKEPIEWLVLDKKDGKVLVISKYALDCQPYNQEREGVTWETCTLRSWLNDEFINEAFTNNELSQIPTVTVTADDNPFHDTNPGNNTQDKVFLLSIDEVYEYFSSGNGWECIPTEYAIAQGTDTKETGDNKGNCWWWLRSPGRSQNYAAYVDYYYGCYSNIGINVNRSSNAVRPALWINL